MTRRTSSGKKRLPILHFFAGITTGGDCAGARFEVKAVSGRFEGSVDIVLELILGSWIRYS